VVDFTFQIMNVDRVSILLLEDKSGELVPRVSKGKTGSAAASKHVPQSIARKAVEERVAILSDNAAADERFKGTSILIQSVRSATSPPTSRRSSPSSRTPGGCRAKSAPSSSSSPTSAASPRCPRG